MPLNIAAAISDSKQCALTVNTRIIRILLHANNLPYVEIEPGLRIQVLPDISYLPRCQKHQFAAFIADRGILVVWDDEPRNIIGRTERLEKMLMEMIWGNQSAYPEEAPEGKKAPQVEVAIHELDGDVEARVPEKDRRLVLGTPITVAITLALAIAALGGGWRQVAIEVFVDHGWARLAFILVVPLQIWLALVSSLKPASTRTH